MRLDKVNNAIIKEIARKNDVNYKRLKELYIQITQGNFYTDVCYIAKEFEEELKGDRYER